MDSKKRASRLQAGLLSGVIIRASSSSSIVIVRFKNSSHFKAEHTSRRKYSSISCKIRALVASRPLGKFLIF